MAKVLKIAGDKAVVGMEDNSTKTFDLSNFNYNPLIGDEVEVYGFDENAIISKKEATTATVQGQGNNGSGSQNVYVNVQQTAPVSNGKKVSKVAYLLFCFFLGGIGAHEFYAGHIGRGVAMLLFCWTGIPSIIALVQFFITLFKSSDPNGQIEV